MIKSVRFLKPLAYELPDEPKEESEAGKDKTVEDKGANDKPKPEKSNKGDASDAEQIKLDL